MTFDLARLRTIAKSIVAATSAGLVGSTGALIFIPAEAGAPWWAYVVVGLLNAILVGLATYKVPNASPASAPPVAQYLPPFLASGPLLTHSSSEPSSLATYRVPNAQPSVEGQG